jgi:hypothetical protein
MWVCTEYIQLKVRMIVIFVIGATATALMLPDTYAYASTTSEEFDPDESCLFDVEQPKCQLPEDMDDCPEGFGTNEDRQCFPVDENGYMNCPDGYHAEDDDGSGQCYPDDTGCQYDDMILIEASDGDGMRCASLDYICNEDEHRNEDYCVTYCEENPERTVCNREA